MLIVSFISSRLYNRSMNSNEVTAMRSEFPEMDTSIAPRGTYCVLVVDRSFASLLGWIRGDWWDYLIINLSSNTPNTRYLPSLDASIVETVSIKYSDLVSLYLRVVYKVKNYHWPGLQVFQGRINIIFR